MENRRKYYKGPANVVYNIDGASYGMDDGLAEAIQASIRSKLKDGTLVIPRLPKVAGRILQLSQDPDVQVSEVTKAIMSDPILAARVLGMANSAAHGGSGQVEGLDAAITRLGMKTLCNIVFAESAKTKIFPARAYREMLEQSWHLSLGSAIACEAISRVTGLERQGAFLLGLLHDTGKPTLINAISEYERKNDNQPLGDELVEIVLSQLHEEIGAYVLEQWEMPEAIVEAAGGHHNYRGPNSKPAHKVIFAANLICQHQGVGDIQGAISFNLERVFIDLKLTDAGTLDKILDGVTRNMETLLASFGGLSPAGT